MHTIIITLPLLLVPVISFAVESFPAFPMAFWGDVTVNDTSAPVGTVIRAYYGDTLAGQIVVQESGVYGYTESTRQKLLVSEGIGQIAFKFQLPAFNSGAETEGTTLITHSSFASGEVVNKDLVFTVSVPVSPPPPSSGGGGSGGGGGSSGGGGGGGGGGGVVLGATTKKGDANGDDKIDILDFNLLMINWGNNSQNKIADLDGDSKIDIFDFNILMVNWSK